MSKDIKEIIQHFKTCIEDASYIQGSERGINFNQGQKLTWDVSNSDNLNSICCHEIENIEDALTVINTFSEGGTITKEYLREKCPTNWTKPNFLHLYKRI